MHNVRWLRVLGVLSWTLVLGAGAGLLGGCTVPEGDAPGPHRDMSMDNTGGGPVDMKMVDLARPPGAIGASCSGNADCKFGKAPSCWTKNVLNEPGDLPTAGGYCTSTCDTDADCGGQGVCTLIVTGQSKYCLASCSDGVTCRHPDYACLVNSPTGYCWPALRLTCNPTLGKGTCDDGRACIRRAYEDLGECHDTCMLGPNTCPFLPNNTRQHCVYINATRDTKGVATRDTYKGNACFPLLTDARMEGANCNYFDECADGLQCNLSPGGDNKCRELCLIGVAGACGSDPGIVCKDVFGAGLGQAGLCVAK